MALINWAGGLLVIDDPPCLVARSVSEAFSYSFIASVKIPIARRAGLKLL
jgi:hypothetical protein